MYLIRVTPLLLAGLLLAPAFAQEKDKKDPILAEVKASLKDLNKPFTMFVNLKVKEGANAKFEAAVAKAVIETRKEKGNKAYKLSRSAKAPNEYVMYERWQNYAALQAHMKSPHFAALIAEVGDLLAGPPQVQVFLPTAE